MKLFQLNAVEKLKILVFQLFLEHVVKLTRLLVIDMQNSFRLGKGNANAICIVRQVQGCYLEKKNWQGLMKCVWPHVCGRVYSIHWTIQSHWTLLILSESVRWSWHKIFILLQFASNTIDDCTEDSIHLCESFHFIFTLGTNSHEFNDF